MKQNSWIIEYKYSFLLLGLLLIFSASSLYIFTKPAIWDTLNFSNKGQIGDTIGGITAPVINSVGAILVFVSFQAQIKANKIQADLLKQGTNNQNYDRNFKVAIDLLNELKDDVNNLVYQDQYMSSEERGVAALTTFVNRLHNTWTKIVFNKHLGNTIYARYRFILSEFDLITYHIETSNFREGEKEKLSIFVKNYYLTHLRNSADIMKGYLEKFDGNSDTLYYINQFEDLFNEEQV